MIDAYLRRQYFGAHSTHRPAPGDAGMRKTQAESAAFCVVLSIRKTSLAQSASLQTTPETLPSQSSINLVAVTISRWHSHRLKGDLAATNMSFV